MYTGGNEYQQFEDVNEIDYRINIIKNEKINKKQIQEEYEEISKVI